MKNHSLKYALAAATFAATLATPNLAQAVTCASVDGGPPNFGGQCTAPATNFIQTINSARLIRLNADGSSTFVNMGSAAKSYDFASVSAGSDLGSFLDGAAIPEGTYVGFSAIIDKFATINGSTTVDGMTCRTATTGHNPSVGTSAAYTYDFITGNSFFTSGSDTAYNYSTAAAFEQWTNGAGDLVIAQKFPSTISVAEGNTAPVSVDIQFDAIDAISYIFNGFTCTNAGVGPLSVTISTTQGTSTPSEELEQLTAK